MDNGDPSHESHFETLCRYPQFYDIRASDWCHEADYHYNWRYSTLAATFLSVKPATEYRLEIYGFRSSTLAPLFCIPVLVLDSGIGLNSGHSAGEIAVYWF